MAAVITGAPTGGATAQRKAEHIRINVERDVDAKGVSSGFDAYRFVHRALPELDLAEVDLATEFLGKRLGAPLLISCMTGGTADAAAINASLAEVAQQHGLAMGLGSCRVLLENPDVLPTFAIRHLAPDILLFANLGAVQLNRGIDAADCARLVELLGADVLVLHLNALQEALQAEGDTCFRGLLEKIRELCRDLEIPVIVKEVGWGIAADLVVALLDAGVSGVDVAGAGGTSWSEVERHRMNDPVRAEVAAAFAGWGTPTAVALRMARAAAPDARLIASGGIRDGIDVAKAIALGAELVGVAGPFLRAAVQGREGVEMAAAQILEVLRVAMFCVGARTVRDLRYTPWLVEIGAPRDTGPARAWIPRDGAAPGI